MFRVSNSFLLAVVLFVASTGSAAVHQNETQTRIQQKVQQVEATFPKWVESGGNPRILESLTQKLDGYMSAGNFVDAEGTLDKILAIMTGEEGAVAPATNETVVERVQRKAKEFQEKAPLWASRGGDPNKIRPLAKQLEVHLKAGEPEKADPILDELLAIVGETSDVVSAPIPPMSTTPQSVRLSKIPESAEIVFHHNELIYVMDSNGENITQLTFDKGRHLEHVAVSYDRKRVVANYFANPSQGHRSSRLVLFDLEQGTQRGLVPFFLMAGNGGVEWDRDGFIYFAGVEREPFENPRGRDEFIANAAANDVYKVKYDGSGLKRLTWTDKRGEADVSVSEDGTMVSYMATYIDPPDDSTEIWVNSSDGDDPVLVYVGGKMKVSSVHDPELSPDNSEVIFSRVNPAFKNFPSDPNADTAHDLYRVRLDGSGLQRVTEPGPISVVPDWVDDRVLFLLLTDRERPPFGGIAVMNSDGTELRRINSKANIAKWIPSTR